MANIRINELPAATTIADTDLIIVGNPTTGLMKAIPWGILKGLNVAPVALAFTTQPANATIAPGGSNAFAAIWVGGTGPFTAVWKLGTTTLPGGTATTSGHSSTYGLSNATTDSGGNYTLEVTDSLGVKIISSVALLTISLAFGISVQPSAQTVNVGGSFNMGVTVINGTPNFTFQLKKNGANYGSPITQAGRAVTSSSISAADVGTSNWNYVITDSTGATLTSSTVVVTVNAAGVIARWGDYAAKTLPSEANILDAPYFAVFAHNATIVADWRATTGTPRFLLLFVRVTETAPTAWVDNGNPANTAVIGASGAFETFNILGTVTATDGGGNWLVIGSFEKTDFANTVSFTH